MKTIDLRSDTVTLPSPAMREAMYRAELGDDVFGEDPTVNRLQEMAAERMGKEAALFVASGTMGNLVALLTHCGRGDGAIMGNLSHTFLNEAGGSAALGGVYLLAVPNQPDGTIDPAVIERVIPVEDIHHPRVRLICLENTHNYCNGAPLTAQYTAEVAALARRHGMALHLDGARIFNAAIALGVEARELAAPVDSVMFCLSKGLSCPVGSLLCGSAEFIERARRMRKMVGGGMRQAGVLAAAGIVALEQMVDRLEEDHENARILAQGIAEIPGLGLDPKTVRTNIVFFDFLDRRMTVEQFIAALQKEGVLILALGPNRLRAVTHYGIERADIERALQVMRRVMTA
ncbi:MAG: low-specificity L-threonine aldolase [Chloroflexi bacterium]|nr:low-specificity L-threonine aldolase [Chloroflexota bacterium]